jgi:hypothetical protein
MDPSIQVAEFGLCVWVYLDLDAADLELFWREISNLS